METQDLTHRFMSGIAWNIVGKVIQGLSGFLISILVVRSLGKDNLGIYATLLTIPAIMRLLSSFGFETSLNIKLPMFMVSDHEGHSVFLIRRLLLRRIIVSDPNLTPKIREVTSELKSVEHLSWQVVTLGHTAFKRLKDMGIPCKNIDSYFFEDDHFWDYKEAIKIS